MKDLNEYTVDEQLEAVLKYQHLIQYIDDPSLEVQLAAVTKLRYVTQDVIITFGFLADDAAPDGYMIQYIKDPMLEVQLVAVKQDGLAIQHIKCPTLEVQLAAVTEDASSIQYIDNPCQEVILLSKLS